MKCESSKYTFTSRLLAASEAVPEVLAMLLGDFYENLSASHVTNDFTDARIRRNGNCKKNFAC